MFCFRCGGSMPDTETVCPQCGAAVADAPKPAPPSMPPQGIPYTIPQMQAPLGYGPPPTDGKATASLVFGILSILCCGALAGIPAIILGHISRSKIRKSMGQLTGTGMATAGLVMGYISIGHSLVIWPAIIIPNIIKDRVEANEMAAKSAMRSLNTAEITYVTNYPDAGYARNLATLGPGSSRTCAGEGSAQNACLIDATLGCTGPWCEKDSYRFNITAADCGGHE